MKTEADANPNSKPSGEALPPFRSAHTSNLPDLFASLGISLAVSTYQAGRLVILRRDGDRINTLFRAFRKPMGIALAGDRIAIGSVNEIVEFRNLPGGAKGTDATPATDACFLPRVTHHTGDVQVHEMAWAGDRRDELWFVNTRFSCLATRSDEYNFVPRWRPRFISGLAAEDRCHLNGLAMVDGRPAFVTALGATDAAHGWRQNKRDGGVLIDVNENQIVVGGLSMPHSPRWHRGALWMLESGNGGVGRVDLRSGKYEEIVRLPGFTRGFAISGDYAFVGLSQVRETAVFSGIALTERPPTERNCGVWVIHIPTGNTVGLLRFEEAVQEIFDVQVLPGMLYPDLINEDPAFLADTFNLPKA